MSQNASANDIFVFGSQRVTPSAAKPTKPVHFTFFTNSEETKSQLDHYPWESMPVHDILRFAAGEITIVDLSDPFIDPGSACALFEIVTRLFVRAEKYWWWTRHTSTLHESWRHWINQIPTHPDTRTKTSGDASAHQYSGAYCCSFRPVGPLHSSRLARHVSADISTEEGFDKVVKLHTGEALVLAPSGMSVFLDGSGTSKTTTEDNSTRTGETARKAPLTHSQFGRRTILMKTRARVTKDGVVSILVVESESESEHEDSEECN